MISLLKKIYEQNEFQIEEKKCDLLFSYKKNKEYIITSLYSEEEISDFFNLGKTTDIINFFNELKKGSDDIQKNTSLVIALKVESIKESYIKLKNIIFNIEEDEYFFRKYVIIYTDDSLKSIENNINIKQQLGQIIKNEDMMEEYQKNVYFSEEFFVAMQFFIKLPFFSFEVDAIPFISLENKLEEVIRQKKLDEIRSSIKNFDIEINQGNEIKYFDKLTEEFLSEQGDTPVLDKFFKHFEEI